LNKSRKNVFFASRVGANRVKSNSLLLLKKISTSTPARLPHINASSSRAKAISTPRARLNRNRFGLSSTELTINAASSCCGTFLCPNAAITGTVPYMHSGDNIPKADATPIGRKRASLEPRLVIFTAMRSEQYTDMSDPAISPDAQ
jgi:hypothetical protein